MLNKIIYMKYIKFIIAIFFLIASFWLTGLIFEHGFATTDLKYAVNDTNENTLMILIISTLLSAIGIFFMGVLALFTYFVFVKLLYADEIKRGAFQLLKYRRNKKNAKRDMVKDTTEMIKS